MLKDCYLLPCSLVDRFLSFVCTFYTQPAHPENKPDRFTSNSRTTNNNQRTNNEWASEPNEPIRTMNEPQSNDEFLHSPTKNGQKNAAPPYNHADCRMYTESQTPTIYICKRITNEQQLTHWFTTINNNLSKQSL